MCLSWLLKTYANTFDPRGKTTAGLLYWLEYNPQKEKKYLIETLWGHSATAVAHSRVFRFRFC